MDPISELTTRGVANIIPSKDDLEKLLHSDKKLNVYCGFDVTAPQLHLGNTVPMRKLQQFVNLGHNVTFLIGDFTTLVGDTSDKDTERPIIPEDEIDKNWQNFSRQAGKVLDLSKVQIRRNSEWLDKLSIREIIRLARRFSLNDFSSRELIKKRLTEGKSVNLSEVLYPILQGYDSYFMDTDIQIGGTDQTFNMQAGRTLQKQLRNKDSFVMSFEFLMGTDGRKMSKSWGNAVWLDDPPNDMYGKIMSIKDELINQYFLLATNLEKEQIQEYTQGLHEGNTNPILAKKALAFEIVKELYDKSSAEQAESYFVSTIQQGEIPSDIPSISISTLKSTNIVDVLVETHLASSKSEARRLISQGGVQINAEKITDQTYILYPTSYNLIRVGPRKFLKITS